MTATGTRTASFTLTDARYVGSKIGADLQLLNALYGQPARTRIDDYAEEVAQLLNGGYLGTVDYGFTDEHRTWKLRVRYTATVGGYLTDNRPGKLPTAAEVSGYSFYSYLAYSTKYHALTPAQQSAVRETLPVTRGSADAPLLGTGRTDSGYGYARHGAGVTRNVFAAF